MHKAILMLALLACACSDQSSEADEASAQSIAPQKILYPDIEANKLYGLSCAFVPEGGGIGAIALAMPDSGYLKLDGAIEKFEPANADQDIGPPEMSFTGDSFAFTLGLDAESARNRGNETIEYDARLTISKRQGSPIFEASGLAQCGA